MSQYSAFGSSGQIRIRCLLWPIQFFAGRSDNSNRPNIAANFDIHSPCFGMEREPIDPSARESVAADSRCQRADTSPLMSECFFGTRRGRKGQCGAGAILRLFKHSDARLQSRKWAISQRLVTLRNKKSLLLRGNSRPFCKCTFKSYIKSIDLVFKGLCSDTFVEEST